MGRLELGFSQPECSALTTTLWDTRIFISNVDAFFNERFLLTKYHNQFACIFKRIVGSREEDKVAGFFVFSYIRMRGYFRLDKVKVNECHVGLEPPAGARNRRKATVKIRRIQETRNFARFLPLIQVVL